MRYAFIPFFSILFWGISFGQSTSQNSSQATAKGLYDEIPFTDRQSFILSVNKVIELQKAGDWEAVYYWLDNENNISMKEFIRGKGKLRLIDFVIDRIAFFPPKGVWLIRGCAEFYPVPRILKGRSNRVYCGFDARLTKDGWRFSSPPGIIVSKDYKNGIKSCDIDTRLPQQ